MRFLMFPSIGRQTLGVLALSLSAQFSYGVTPTNTEASAECASHVRATHHPNYEGTGGLTYPNCIDDATNHITFIYCGSGSFNGPNGVYTDTYCSRTASTALTRVSFQWACPEGYGYNAETKQCVEFRCDPPMELIDGVCKMPPSCPQGSTETPEGCFCPEGTKVGYKTGPDGSLIEACISDVPPEPQQCENPVGYINGEPICDNQHTCPEGHNPGLVNGEQVCIADTTNPQCPDGGYYGTVNGTTGCFDPAPNVDNPDYPPNADPTSPSYPGPDPTNPTYPNDPNWPSANNPNYTGGTGGTTEPPPSGDFDDSRIVGRLDQTNQKLTGIDSKLGEGNQKLDGIDGKIGEGNQHLSDINDFFKEAGEAPAHTDNAGATFESVNAGVAARLRAAPVMSAMAGMANIVTVTAGDCPEFSLDLPAPIDTTVSTTMHCEVYSLIAPPLSAVMIIVYLFIGFRIFASA